jgi:hypothetical protein
LPWPGDGRVKNRDFVSRAPIRAFYHGGLQEYHGAKLFELQHMLWPDVAAGAEGVPGIHGQGASCLQKPRSFQDEEVGCEADS